MARKKSKIYWSIIVPCYNETRRIDNLIRIFTFLRKLKRTWEVIVVNDGSSDDTLTKLKILKKKYDFNLISYSKNRGKGYAVKKGMLTARGEHRLFLDVDLSTPIETIDKFAEFVDKNDVVIGTRRNKLSKVLVHQSPLRENLGRVFTFLSQVVLGANISDFTCGFKCFSETSAEKIFAKTRIYRWGFDSESLFLAKKYGFSIKEVPVTWKNDQGTRVKFPGDIINSLTELLRIRFFDWVEGVY